MVRAWRSLASGPGPSAGGGQRSKLEELSAFARCASAIRLRAAELDDQIRLDAEPEITVGRDAAEGSAEDRSLGP